MTREDHFTFRTRLYILEKMLTEQQKLHMSYIYEVIWFIYNGLIKSKVSFDVETLTYDEIVKFNNPELNNILKILGKKETNGILQWLNIIYHFKDVVDSDFNGLSASFSNKEISLKITKNNISAFFDIDGSLLRYRAYTIDGIYHLVNETILFKRTTLNRFVDNIEEYYCVEKSVLEMIFL